MHAGPKAAHHQCCPCTGPLATPQAEDDEASRREKMRRVSHESHRQSLDSVSGTIPGSPPIRVASAAAQGADDPGGRPQVATGRSVRWEVEPSSEESSACATPIGSPATAQGTPQRAAAARSPGAPASAGTGRSFSRLAQPVDGEAMRARLEELTPAEVLHELLGDLYIDHSWLQMGERGLVYVRVSGGRVHRAGGSWGPADRYL